MISAARKTKRVLIHEGRDTKPLDSSEWLQLVTALLERGYSVRNIRGEGPLADLGHDELIVLGKFGEQAPALAAGNGAAAVHVRDIASMDMDAVLETVESISKDEGEQPAPFWKPWFPVIDYDRCNNCMRCLSFCLFDVYGVSKDGKITVQNKSNCKTDCPACSRVCPEMAILFPKYKAGPINGDEISDDDLRRESMKVDISDHLGGDIYSMLRDRSEKAKSRFSVERDDERALKERQRCLKKLQNTLDGLDIPPEVLSSLPSVDEIRNKAETAKQRAQQAAGGQQQ